MQTTFAVEETETSRVARRAAELIRSATDVLREEIDEDGALSRAAERVVRVSRGLYHGTLMDESFVGAVRATHQVLSHVLAIGRAVEQALDPRARQCLETLAAAQHLLHPLAHPGGCARPAPSEPRAVPSGVERRASPRVELDVEVGFESETNFYQGFSEDVSDGGLFVATYQHAPIGTVFDLEFTLPTGHIVRTQAEVRWLRDLRDDSSDVSPGMGLSFRGLAPEDARAITEFVRDRSPIFYED